MVCLLQSQLSPGPCGAYRECLGKLELQYAKLLVRAGGVGGNGGQTWGDLLGRGCVTWGGPADGV